MNHEHIADIANVIHQRIEVLEHVFQNDVEAVFAFKSDIICSEFSKDMEKFSNHDPNLISLLKKTSRDF